MFSVALGVISPQIRTQPRAVISGVLAHDRLFVAYPNKEAAKYGGDLFRGPSDAKAGRSGWDAVLRVPYRALVTDERKGVCKSFIAGDCFWYVAPGSESFHAIPLEDLNYYEASQEARKRETEKFGKHSSNELGAYMYWVKQLFFSDTFESYGDLYKAIENAIPIREIEQATAVPNYMSIVERNACYDLIPTGIDTFTLVHHSADMVHVPKDSLVFQKMKLGTPSRSKRNEHITRLPDSKPFIVNAPFEGDFWAYEVGGVYYLLTRKGKLYAVKKNKESVATSTIWQDEKKYLIGAIQDVAKGTVYAFGVDGKDGERFAFEFGLEPKVTKYKTEAKVGDGFKEAQDCVRAVKAAARKK